jgi:hypothetical protein
VNGRGREFKVRGMGAEVAINLSNIKIYTSASKKKAGIYLKFY